MLIPFQSKAAGEFFMQQTHVLPLFQLMGKPFTPQGILVASELGSYMAQLKTGLERAQSTEVDAADEQPDPQAVGLKQRAWPLMDMMQKAQAKGVDITWGVLV
jgi:Domain of unknown function (DUF1840)